MPSKVVVIDNDRQVRDVVCAALEDDGLVAVGVGSYAEALSSSADPRPIWRSVMVSRRMG